MNNPFQKHRERKERRELEGLIKFESALYEKTLNEDVRKRLVSLHRRYEIKYGRDYGK